MARRKTIAAALLLVGLCLSAGYPAAAQDEASITRAARDPQGWLVHRVRSPYQAAATQIQVLLPDRLEENRKYPVVYVLPVEAGNGDRWGNPLAEVKKADLHNKHSVICVVPTFSQLPWYCDHPRDKAIRQESHLLKLVIPYVERTYPAIAQRDGRLLAGFSKSGWGAWSLLLRHPEKFQRAAAWDAPLMLTEPKQYGTGPIFGSQENFDQYRLDRQVKRQAKAVGRSERLILLGYGNFRSDHQRMHQRLDQLKVPHIHRDGPERKHHWNSDWLPEAFSLLTAPEPSNADRSAKPACG